MFADIAAATNALRGMADFPFFERELVRRRCRPPSALHCASVVGSRMPSPRTCCCHDIPSSQLPELLHASLLLLLLLLQRVSFARSTSNAVTAATKGKGKAKGKATKAAKAAAEGGGAAGAAAGEKPAAASGGGGAAAVDVGRPNSKLFVEGLPAATTAAMLEMLFQQFPGGPGSGGRARAGRVRSAASGTP